MLALLREPENAQVISVSAQNPTQASARSDSKLVYLWSAVNDY
jgi:hypothetical protein